VAGIADTGERVDGAIAMAQEQAPAVDVRACAMPPIPFPEASFDTVVAFETIEHTEDAAFVAEIRRERCHRGRWRDRLAHGMGEVESWDRGEPMYRILRATSD
jgi:hypothetical protein